MLEGQLHDSMQPPLDRALDAARKLLHGGIAGEHEALPDPPPLGLGLIGVVSRAGFGFGAGEIRSLASEEHSQPIMRGVLEIRQALVKARG
jgi:hypothetical protein